MLQSCDIGFAPGSTFHSEMQFHWDTVTQAQRVSFFEASSCRPSGRRAPSPPAYQESALTDEQLALIDAMHFTQRVLERKLINPLVLVQFDDERRKVEPSVPYVTSSRDEVARHHGGETCSKICERHGVVSMPSESGMLATNAWIQYVGQKITDAGILQHCHALAVRSADVTATALLAGILSSDSCPPNLGHCECPPTSKLAKRHAMFNNIRSFRTKQKLHASPATRNESWANVNLTIQSLKAAQPKVAQAL
jgi:hypothetical protein